MALETFSDEFRHFKFLKSCPELVEHVKQCRIKFNQVRPADQVDNNEFAWSSRIEFIDQLLEFQYSKIYLVEPGMLTSKTLIDYETAKIHYLPEPRIIKGHPISGDYRAIRLEDIPIIESHTDGDPGFFLTTDQCLEFGPTHINFRAIRLSTLSLLPGTFFNYNALFYDEEEANAYGRAITEFLRKNLGAISAISRLL